jgi:hypothetical protein
LHIGTFRTTGAFPCRSSAMVHDRAPLLTQ